VVNGVAHPLACAQPASEPIELLIGRTTATAASLLAAEVQEWQTGNRKLATSRQAADAIAMLFELRAATLATGELAMPFEEIARAQGIAMLRRHCDNSDGLIADLIDEVISILTNIVVTQAHWDSSHG
jgi:hypothetical protein